VAQSEAGSAIWREIGEIVRVFMVEHLAHRETIR